MKKLLELIQRLPGAPCACALLFFVFGLFIRWPALERAFYLNEDAALILAARRIFELGEFLPLFTRGSGPSVIRPLQTLGLIFEFQILKLSAFYSLLIGIGILSIGQAILVSIFRKIADSPAAVLGALLIGCSPLSLEPTLWISDRHDLYLLLFSTIALAAAQRLYLSGRQAVTYIIFIFSLWLSFWSNEKAVVVPVLIPVGLYLIYGDFKKILSRTAIPAGFLLCAYFLYRFSVLGTFIGGYDDTVLPDTLPLSALIFNIFSRSAAVLFWQYATLSPLLLLTQILIFTGILLLICCFSETKKSSKKLWILTGSTLLLLVSSAPTYRYTSQIYFGNQLNSRLLWLPWITSCLILTVLILKSKPDPFVRRMAGILFALFTLISAWTTFEVSRGYSTAFTLSRRAVVAANQVCSCVPVRDPIATGFPPTIQGVNTLTFPLWFNRTLQLVSSKPRCAPGVQSCQLTFGRCRRGSCDMLVTQSDSPLLKQHKDFSYTPTLTDGVIFAITARNSKKFKSISTCEGYALHREAGLFDFIVLRAGEQTAWVGRTGNRVDSTRRVQRGNRAGFSIPEKVLRAASSDGPLSLYGVLDKKTFYLDTIEPLQ